MLSIQDPQNKPFNTSAILSDIITSCRAAKYIMNEFPDPKNVSVHSKIMILGVLQSELL